MSLQCGWPKGASQNAIISFLFLQKEIYVTACESLFAHKEKNSGTVYESCIATDTQRDGCLSYSHNCAEATSREQIIPYRLVMVVSRRLFWNPEHLSLSGTCTLW